MTAPMMMTYPARIERIIDGDTVVARLDLGLGVEILQHVQLAGVNAPERHTDAGKQAKVFVEERLLHRPVTVSINPQRPRDTFGRLLGVIAMDELNFNQALLDAGQAVPYPAPKAG